MKKISKRLLSLMLAMIMAMPVIIAMPSAASAHDGYSSHLVAHYFIDNNFTKDYWQGNDLEQVNGGTYYWSNGGVQFPGGNPKPYFRIAASRLLSNVNFSTGFTVAFSARRANSSWERYFEFTNDPGFKNGGNAKYLYFATNGNAKANNGGETGSPNVGDDGGWHNWVMIIKQGSFQLFRDGNDCGTVSSDKLSNDWYNEIKNNGYFLFGASSYGGDGAFSGFLKNFKVYDTALSSSQIGECDDDELFQYTFDNTFNERFTGSSNAAAVMQSYNGSGYSNEGDHIYCKDAWMMSSVPASIRSEEHKKHWRMDFDFNPTQDFGANRLELMPGITDKTGLDSNYNGSQSFGMSTNGKIYFRTTDFNNGAWGDTGLNLKQWYANNGKKRVTVSYAYHDGVISVLVDWVLKFQRDVSEYKSFFENINTVTYPGRNGAGVYMDLWDFSCHSYWDLPVYSSLETENAANHLKGRYFLGDIEANFVSDNFDFSVSGSGAEWQSSDEIEGAHFNGGNSGNSPNFLYLPKGTTKSMFIATNNHTGFTFSFMSKSLHDNSWQRIFELTNVGSAYGGGSGNRYAMFTSQYDGSAHSNCYSGNSELNVLGGVASWHVWTLTYKQGAVIVYRDGTEVRREENSMFSAAWFNEILTNGQILLGASTFGDPGFDGYIRDLRIYDIALNSSQVSEVYTDTYNNRTYFDGATGEARTAAINSLQSAMTAYENKMKNMGSDFYTNTKAAYDAYVVASRYYDSLVYGNSQKITVNQVNRVVNNLNTAKDNMGNWSYKNATNHGRFSSDADYVSDDNYRETYNKVIWASEVNNNSGDSTVWGDEISIYSDKEKCNPRLFHPVAVLMYDGQSQPYLPVFSYFRHWCKGGTNYKYNWYYSSAYISDNGNGLVIANTKWRNGSSGSDESFNYQWNYLKDGGKEVNVYNYYRTDDKQHWSKGFWGSTAWNLAYANQLKFTGSLGSSEYLRTITPTWGFVFWNQTSNIKNPTYVGSKSIYVINYKAVRDALSAAKTTCANVANYKEGGLATFFQGCDEATSINPDGYGWSKDNVATKANDLKNDISNAIGHINTKTADSLYVSLRAEMMTSHNTHPTGHSAEYDFTHYWDIYNDYTPNSMSAFWNAYYNAQWHMEALRNNNYFWENGDDNVNRLNTLVNAHAGLKRRASFSALDTAYTKAQNDFSALTASDYTTSTYNAAQTFLSNAANFPYHSKNSDDRANTPEVPDQTSIDSEETSLSNALNNLERRADFTALDAAKKEWTDYLAAHSAEYTTSSKASLSNYINSSSEFPLENTADRADTGVSKNSQISGEITKYGNIEAGDYLDPLADMTYFDAEYDKANTFLINLDNKAAEYTADSMQTLINAMKATNVETYANANAAARADYGHSVQTNAEILANNIKTAMAGLEKVETVVPQSVDTSALEAALVKINNIDPDAYNVESGSISSAMAGVNAVLSSDETQKEYNGATINVLNGTITQQNVEDATNAILNALTVSTKKYGIFKNEGSADFDITAKNGEYKNNQATYGTTLVCDAGDAETAWYLEIQTGSMHKELAYAGAGQRFQTKVLGTTTIKAVKEGANQKRVKILRQYGTAAITDKSPVQLVDYVDSGADFEFPAAPAIAFYTFDGYYIGETKYAAGASVTISADTEIIARYNANLGADCAITATARANGKGFNDSVAYNTKIELEGGDGAYAWVEETDSTGTHFRPFYIGADVSFFASESTKLKAVTKEEFDAYKFTLPAVNLRKNGVYVVGGKTTFNAQIVPGNANVQEYGILIAAPYGTTPASSIDPTQVVIENSGKHADEGYQILRAKSTKLVGANQFTISVNGIPSGYVYRGYLIYADADGTLHNVYSEAMR